jgi:hypothetical protein
MDPTENKTADKKAYMREYMKKRYHANLEGSRAYTKSLKAKKKNYITDEEFKTYGLHLANVLKLRQIKEELPPEIFQQIMAEQPPEV